MIFSKLKENLIKTKENIDKKISNVFNGNSDINDIIDGIEEVLILSDISMNTSIKICDNLRIKLKKEKDRSEENVKRLLKEEMISLIRKDEDTSDNNSKRVILVVGVNGVGKTTSIAKLTNLYLKQGKKVLLAAADTFRAGAIEQLDIWAKRCNTDIVLGKEMQDPSSVIYDAMDKFNNNDYDILICDTAGRLHNKKNLMDELQKMKNVILKKENNLVIDTYIVIDGTTGQNAVSQVKSFYEKTSVNGIILTKLDSTSKGGIVLSIIDELNIPVKYIGFGEQIDDISEFDAEKFIDSII